MPANDASVLTKVPLESSGSAVIDERVRRFSEALATVRELKRKRDKIQEAVDSVHNRTFLAKHRGELGGFQCPQSDRTARNQELAEYLRSDEEYQLLSAKLAEAQEAYDAASDLVSQLKYYQRERQAQAGDDFGNALKRFEKTAKTLAAALELFVSIHGSKGA